MATIKFDNPLCVYCYKPAIITECSDSDKNETTQEIPKRFLNLLSRHLNIKFHELQCTDTCNDCLGILKAFCELYHQIKCLELRLNWQIDKLLNVMRWADRVPSRLKWFRTTNNFENKIQFRKNLKRKYKRQISKSYPRVSISVLQSSVIPKIEKLNVLNEEHNEEITIDEFEVISIAAEDNSVNFCVNEREKVDHFLLGWVTTFSVLLLLCNLETNKSQIQGEPDIVLLDVNDDNTSEIPPVSPASQANSPLASVSDHEDNCDDDYHSPELENRIDFEQDSSKYNTEMHTIKEEPRDIEPFPTTANSYFKTPLCPVLDAPELMSLQTESSTDLETVNTVYQPTESQISVLSLLPEPHISTTVEPKMFPSCVLSDNSSSKQLLADSKLTATNIPSTSSPLQDNTEASVIPAGRRCLRTKYQCWKCKATFSDINRFQGHQQTCLSTNNTESDSENHSENDDNNDNVKLMTEHEPNYNEEVASSSEDYSDDELKHEINSSDLCSKVPCQLPRSKHTRKKTETESNIHIKKITPGNTHSCVKCIPNMSFHTIYALKRHEYHKHSNGRVTIDKDKISRPDVKSIRMDGLSITTKYTCTSSKCAETFLLPQELENHEKLHNKFSCSICDLTVKHALKLINHELKHSNETQKLANSDFKIGEIFACARCDYKTQTKKELVNHYLGEHLLLPLIKAKCPICQQEFLHVERVSLVHYINYHDLNRLDNPDDKVTCTEPDCSAYFLTEDQLHVHWNRHHVSGCTSEESRVLMQRKMAKRRKHLDRVKRVHKNHSCSHCQKRFLRPGNLRSHFNRVHVKEMGYKHAEGTRGNYNISKEGVTINDIVLEQNAKYFCKKDNCQEKFRSEEDFERHSKLHGEFACNFCPVVKSFAVDLAIHEIVHVTGNDNNINGQRFTGYLRLNVYKCSRCPFRTGRRKRYLDHFLRKHLNLRMDEKRCPICKYAFETDIYKKPIMISSLKNAVHQHFMNWHDFTDIEGGEDKGAKKCDKCAAYFKTKLQLLYHNDDVHNSDKSKCEDVWSNVCVDCGKDFSDISCLRLHRKVTHKVELKFACEFEGCSKKFETVQGLMYHENLNHGTKETFICTDCGKSFFSNYALIAHTKSHEEKVKTIIVKKCHVCEKCGKSFKDRQKLNQHYMFHEGPESWEFECEICKKKMSSKQKLNEHMRTHTKEKPFVCQVCGVAYAHRHNLRNHTNSKHKEVEDVASKRVSTNFASWRKGKKLK